MKNIRIGDALSGFYAHEVDDAGTYTYILKINLAAQVLIQRVHNTTEEIRYYWKPTDASIATFWAGRTGYVYNYIHLI